MDVNEQRFYQVIQNIIQAGNNLKEIEDSVEEYENTIQANLTGEEDIAFIRLALQDEKRRRTIWINQNSQFVPELNAHKKYHFFENLGFVFIVDLLIDFYAIIMLIKKLNAPPNIVKTTLILHIDLIKKKAKQVKIV